MSCKDVPRCALGCGRGPIVSFLAAMAPNVRRRTCAVEGAVTSECPYSPGCPIRSCSCTGCGSVRVSVPLDLISSISIPVPTRRHGPAENCSLILSLVEIRTWDNGPMRHSIEVRPRPCRFSFAFLLFMPAARNISTLCDQPCPRALFIRTPGELFCHFSNGAPQGRWLKKVWALRGRSLHHSSKLKESCGHPDKRVADILHPPVRKFGCRD
ncbi:uncharacterized protein BKA78DRAFT_181868 [Phyllosticta capitalensis]|uniref:uncharacterized protein n=1 Tax=Phyllosticta capitalensis TaxID=121624 RepID=UPI0031316D3E